MSSLALYGSPLYRAEAGTAVAKNSRCRESAGAPPLRSTPLPAHLGAAAFADCDVDAQSEARTSAARAAANSAQLSRRVEARLRSALPSLFGKARAASLGCAAPRVERELLLPGSQPLGKFAEDLQMSWLADRHKQFCSAQPANERRPLLSGAGDAARAIEYVEDLSLSDFELDQRGSDWSLEQCFERVDLDQLFAPELSLCQALHEVQLRSE